MRTDKLRIADHAVIRYMERVLSLDIDQFKQTILNDIGADEVQFKGKYPVSNGKRAVIENKTVVTFI